MNALEWDSQKPKELRMMDREEFPPYRDSGHSVLVSPPRAYTANMFASELMMHQPNDKKQ